MNMLEIDKAKLRRDLKQMDDPRVADAKRVLI